MSNPVLDLRNPNNKLETRSYQTPEEKKVGKDLFAWAAYEYIYREHSPAWFLKTGGVAVLFIIFGIVTKSYFFITLVALAFLVMVLYAKRRPQKINFAIVKEGVGVGGKFYDFSGLKSFWIFEKEGERELSLETDKAFAHFVRLPLGDADPAKIRKILGNFLPEEEHKKSVSEEVAKILGL